MYWQENEDAYHQLLMEYYASMPCRMDGVVLTRSSPNWGRVPFQTLPPREQWQPVRPAKRGFDALESIEPSPRRKIVVRGPGPVQVQ